ncbi:MAG: EmrB/QacA family drug resistance transporter, partial [Porphyrobacter sp.]|nr:EmrB/QacA family drug resistance transporter [Porphyrobacter sp.]
RITEGLNPLNPSYVEGINRLNQQIGGGASDQPLAPIGALYQQIGQQAQMLSYIDVFHWMMIVVLVITPLGLFIRQGTSRGPHGA